MQAAATLSEANFRQNHNGEVVDRGCLGFSPSQTC